MSDLPEILFNILLEGTVEAVGSKKIPLPVRIA